MISFASEEAAQGFDNPLEMLHACHGKILRQCITLEKLATHLTRNGCDQRKLFMCARKMIFYPEYPK
ncbi:MAG: hypothetical protein WAW75_10645 [Gallionella sp.]